MGHANGTIATSRNHWAWYLVVASLMIGLVVVMGGKAVACDVSNDPFHAEFPEVELYDGTDNDCDGIIDEGFWGTTGAPFVLLALVDANPDAVELGETAEVTGRVRVNLVTEFASAELRTGDGPWAPMTATPVSTLYSKDTAIAGTTTPFTTSGDVPVCVRATDALGTVSAESCVNVAVAPAGPVGPSVVFDGFGSPIGPDNELTGARAGRAVPVTFALSDGGATVTSTDDLEVVTTRIADDCGAPAGDAEALAADAAGRSKLRYDADDAQFVFAWKTQRDWAGSCRTVEVLYDGTLVGTAEVAFSR